MREKQTNIRLSSEELLQVQVAAAALEMRPASLMRMFILNGLKNFDMHREGVVAKLDVLQLQLERNETLLDAISKQADSAFLMSAAAVGFLSRSEIPMIKKEDPDLYRKRVLQNMLENIENGEHLKAARESEKSV